MSEEKDNNKIVKASEAASKPIFKVKAVGLAAKREALAAKQKESGVATMEFDGPPEKAVHRIGIVFDDSGSMSGSKIEDAHEGCEEYIRYCDPRTTAISVYPMNPRDHGAIALTTKLYSVAQGIKTFQATGGTPLFETTGNMLDNEALTRGIIFSDGSPNWNDETKKEEVIGKAKEKKIMLDTVFIGEKYDTKAIELMKWIAEQTGGVFIFLEKGKANFRTAFKYLTPGYRALLADKSFVAKIESGEIK